MPLVMAEQNKSKSAPLDALKFVNEAIAEIGRIDEFKELARLARKLLQSVVPNRGVAFLDYDSEAQRHQILDLTPARFLPTVEHYIEEGIVGWVQTQREPVIPVEGLNHGNKGQADMIFIPIHRHDRPVGLVQIWPKNERQIVDEAIRTQLFGIAHFLYNQAELIRVNTIADEARAALDQVALEYEKTNKMVSLGQLAGSVAHEINNPMTTILGRLQLILESENLPEALEERMVIVTKQAKRISNLIHALLSFARGGTQANFSTSFIINDEIRNALELTKHSLEIKQIVCEIDLAKGLPSVKGDPTQLQQVFINLINNAIRAIGDKGKLSIRSQGEEGGLSIVIADTGCGIPPDAVEKIFEPLYSTAQKSGGTGLGLAICRQIVERHGGQISVESKLGKGTQFTINLPQGNKT